MSYIIDTSGNVEREVKNLGWLLAHWKDVTSFEVIKIPGSELGSVILRAALRDGRTYRTNYASACVLRMFLDRPVFRGLLVTWYDSSTHTIGSDSYRAMRESWEK